MAVTSCTFKDIAGKVVIVTGGSSGIGFAMAQAFAENGAHLMLLDIDKEAMTKAKANLERINPQYEVATVSASVTDEDAIEAAFARCESGFGRIDILLNNAGIAINKPSLEVTPEEWRRGIEINLTGVFICAQAAARRMIRQKNGVIINMASMYGVASAPQRAAYCASKAGVVSLTKSLAVEWAPYGIRMNAIGPGYTRTPFVEELVRTGRLNMESLRQRTPLGRLGEPEEMANIALFLASDCSAFVTGHTLIADGGWTANGYM
ncbi:SDR family NAD(P)-dependent oxidoreductase [Geoalkalibacter sp.]|uniref:SDR family NAD(P)-dependent oxidoreductase n=1 Tax=Geoalkalibacter sp. TaxID=3041440 RepID=UPI003FA5E3E4